MPNHNYSLEVSFNSHHNKNGLPLNCMGNLFPWFGNENCYICYLNTDTHTSNRLLGKTQTKDNQKCQMAKMFIVISCFNLWIMQKFGIEPALVYLVSNYQFNNTLQEERCWLKVVVPELDIDKIYAYLGCSKCGKRTDVPVGKDFACTTCSTKDIV